MQTISSNNTKQHPVLCPYRYLSPNIKSDVASLKLLGPLKKVLDHKKGPTEDFLLPFSIPHLYNAFTIKAILGKDFPKFLFCGM